MNADRRRQPIVWSLEFLVFSGRGRAKYSSAKKKD
jgi:hypothetical protein